MSDEEEMEYNIGMKNIIVFATSNHNKVREVREMLSPLGFEVLSLVDLNLRITHPEDAKTFSGNAKIKAEEIALKCDYPVLGDDSGLMIDALDGFPGVHSARFMEGYTYETKNKAILEMMEGKENRRASFHTAMVYIDRKEGIEMTFEGITQGEITKELDPKPIHGFGYDPIFYSYDIGKTFGRATNEEKDSCSHRARALMKVVEYLQTRNGSA